MVKRPDMDEIYLKKKGLELVTLDLLENLEKSFSKLKSSRNQPIRHC